jgi:transposase
MTPDERSAIAQHKEARNKRHREIQEYLSQGLTKREIAELLKVQVASIDRTLDRAKRKGLTQ